MSTQIKQRASIWEVFKSIFSSEIDIEDCDYDKVELLPELEAALKLIKLKEASVEAGISATTKSGRKKDFVKPIINPKIEAAMRKQVKSVKKNEDREIVD